MENKLFTIFKWIIFVPIALLANYLFVIVANIVLNFFDILTTPPSRYENPLLDWILPVIIPVIANIIGIYSYFFIGNKIIQIKENNLTKRKISNIMLLIVILLVSIIFSYLCFKEAEYYKGIINIINILASVIFFSIYYKEY
jgi:tryptophan-rich sensory protein